ncbi:MAG: hypothetical protein JJ850_00535 [Kordiimonadaceae bacterium]|nr:hypothetical protein [Kordiimonadaceae bacterium]MBO6567714.1 hypothetical protein [Kordiimonadaceae bacterium]MBO6963071.1 hypothetical protein [Kordiimonadaceae bacterium]
MVERFKVWSPKLAAVFFVGTALLLTALFNNLDEPELELEAAYGRVLTGEEALLVYEQCSRETPPMPDSVWTPSHEVISEIEQVLPEATRNALWKLKISNIGRWIGGRYVGDLEKELPSLAREYVGAVRDGKKHVYVNLFVDIDRGELFDDGDSGPTVFCDGGIMFFGLEYNVEQQKVTHIAFNGAV